MAEHGEQEEEGGLSWWDAAELIPFVGGVIGVVRSTAKDPTDWWGVGLSAASVVLDVAGLFSFGAGNAASAAVKTGKLARVGIKVAKASTKAGKAMKLTAKGAKAFGAAAAKSVDDIIKATGKVCVFACFPAGTPIQTQNGPVNIENIRVGDLVWSWNEENNAVELKKVTSLKKEETDIIVELHLLDEIIKTTVTHPFKTSEEWTDAGDLKVGDVLKTFDGKNLKINRINFIPKKENVFNFTVDDFHTYYVGINKFLVHNACHTKVFFEAFPLLKGVVGQVHHAIPQNVFKKWPDLFDKKLMNSLENLRGIPKDGMYKLHQGAIHKEWNAFYRLYKEAGIKPTKEAVESMVKKIDDLFGSQFNPPL